MVDCFKDLLVGLDLLFILQPLLHLIEIASLAFKVVSYLELVPMSEGRRKENPRSLFLLTWKEELGVVLLASLMLLPNFVGSLQIKVLQLENQIRLLDLRDSREILLWDLLLMVVLALGVG